MLLDMTAIMVDFTENENGTYTGLVYHGDKIAFRTRECRLKVQALRLAQDWVDEKSVEKQKSIENGITINVQNLSVGIGEIFGNIFKRG